MCVRIVRWRKKEGEEYVKKKENKETFGTSGQHRNCPRGGGTYLLDANYASAADVSGQSVSSSSWGTTPPFPAAAGAITSASDNGNVFNNTLTINSTRTFAFPGNYDTSGAIGGYTIGSGNATGNQVLITSSANLTGYALGALLTGTASTGLAQNNTVTMTGGYVMGRLLGAAVTFGRAGDVDGNKVFLSGGTVTEEVTGGYTADYGNATNNEVRMSGGTAHHIIGGGATNIVGGRGGNSQLNKVFITGGHSTGDVFGGGGTYDAIDNSITMSAGSVDGRLYGGVGRNVSENKINISGGTVGGIVYGGMGRGNVTGNIVTITGGSMASDVYAGNVSMSPGIATDNTINIGDGTNPLASGTTISGTLYGSNQTDATGNTLNVKAKVTAGNVRNFETVNFDVNSTINVGDTFMTLNGTGDSTLDWSKVNVNNLGLLTASPTTGRLLTLFDKTSGNLDFGTSYTNMGARSIGTQANFEYVLDTDTQGTTATKVYLEGYQYQNNTGATVTSGAHPEAWAGRTKIGNTVTNNELTISGGTVNDAYGGVVENNRIVGGVPQTTGDATNNRLKLTGGIITNGIGADVRTASGTASINTIEVSGASVASNAVGAQTSGSGNVNQSTAKITSGSVGSDLIGGRVLSATSTGSATGNTAELTGGSVGGDVAGGSTDGAGSATGNTARIAGGSVTGTVYGGLTNAPSEAGNATGNTVTIEGGSMNDVIAGYAAGSGASNNNTVNIGDGMNALASGTSIGHLYGGNKSGTAAAIAGNTLNIKTNASVLGIHNFETVNFNLNSSTFNTANPLLSITGGGATVLDWGKVNITGGISGTATLLANASGINLGMTYNGAKEISSDGTSEFSVDTNTGTASATSFVYDGLRYKGDTKTVGTSTGTDGVWGGRSKIGNTTTGNTLTLTGGTHENAYGGKTDGTATTQADRYNSTSNMLNLDGGMINHDVVGGETGVAAGNSTDNTVNVNGGTVSGAIYGGRLTHTSATGTAERNIVNIKGGTMGDVYGGAANGTGKAINNIVNIGDGTNPLAPGTTIGGTLYGGNKADDYRGNTLNVNTNVTVQGIKNFENINFNLNSSVNPSHPILNITGAGVTDGLDWAKVDADTATLSNAGGTSYGAFQRTLMRAAGGLSFVKGGVDTYAPIGAKERTSGDYEYVIDTDTHTASAQEVGLTGYRFQNNQGATYTAGDGTHTQAWGGRSTVGHTVANNTLTVSGGMLTTGAYGGIAENHKMSGGVPLTTGDATGNKVVLNAGANVASAYGADVRTRDGAATGNTVELAGGVVSGHIYGGATTAAGATGDATGNTVTILGGTAGGDVYGGHTAGTGNTTGNTVNLGDGVNAVAAGTTVVGKLIGGSGSDATGNMLNVRSKGVTAGGVEKFEKIRFNFASNPGTDAMLTLTGNTTLAYAAIEKPTDSMVSDWLGSDMEKSAKLIQMSGATLSLPDYTSAGAADRVGTAEYAMRTSTDTDTTTGTLDLTAYKWKSARVSVNSGAVNVFGGKTTYGTTGATEENTLTLESGANVTGTAIGGDTQTTDGKAIANSVLLKAGSTAVNAIGGQSRGGAAESNTAAIEGGQATTLTGGAAQSGKVLKNTTEVKGGLVINAIGARSSTGDAEENTAVLTGGTTNTATGARAGAAARDNKVVVESAASVTNAIGAVGATATKNSAEIKGGTISGSIVGGQASGTAAENDVTISGGAVSALITGGISTAGNAEKNTVHVKRDIAGTVVGGNAVAGSALDNIVEIDGVKVTGNVIGATGAVTNDNIVRLRSGAEVTGTVTGGTAGGTGNTLAVYSGGGTAHVNDFANVQNLHFYLSRSSMATDPTLLQLGVTNRSLAGIDVGVGVEGIAPALRVEDTISLMKVGTGGTLTMTDTIPNKTQAMQGVSLLYDFDLKRRGTDELVAVVTKAALSEQTKSLVETRAGASTLINRGADLLANAGMSEAAAASDDENNTQKKSEYSIWAVTEKSNMRTETGSYVDVNGTGLALGWAKTDTRTGGKFLLSPFVEYGRASYNSYLDDGTHGKGKVSYLGLGLLSRMEKKNGLWLEGILHGGGSKSDYSGSIYRTTQTTYDSSSPYLALQLGVGKTHAAGEKGRLDSYVRYFWSHQKGTNASLNSGEVYDFHAVNSHRMRLGTRYTHRQSAQEQLYAGVAYEYEFGGRAGASFQGYETPAATMRGGSVLFEFGWRFAPQNANVTYDMNFSGWQGRRQGVAGSAHVNWKL